VGIEISRAPGERIVWAPRGEPGLRLTERDALAQKDQHVWWRFPASLANFRLDCTLQGILTRCHAGCCTTQGYWPPKAGVVPDACDNLTATGCALGDARPVTCALYPLRLNKNGTMVAHFRGVHQQGGVCHACKGHGPILIEALAGSLAAIFGAEQAAMIQREVLAGRDALAHVPPIVVQQLAVEKTWEEQNIVPTARELVQG
jgi:Fe-S-cluster containining protein